MPNVAWMALRGNAGIDPGVDRHLAAEPRHLVLDITKLHIVDPAAGAEAQPPRRRDIQPRAEADAR